MSLPPDQDDSLAALGRAIRQLRRERGMTQEELARRAHLAPSNLAAIESGRRNPTWGTVRRISYGLALPLPELIRKIEGMD